MSDISWRPWNRPRLIGFLSLRRSLCGCQCQRGRFRQKHGHRRASCLVVYLPNPRDGRQFSPVLSCTLGLDVVTNHLLWKVSLSRRPESILVESLPLILFDMLSVLSQGEESLDGFREYQYWIYWNSLLLGLGNESTIPRTCKWVYDIIVLVVIVIFVVVNDLTMGPWEGKSKILVRVTL